MAEIQLVRNPSMPASQADRDATMRVLLGHVDGLGDDDRKSWRGFLRRLLALDPGGMIEISTKQPRLGWYHRKHMALEHAFFKSQDKFAQFDRFRDWLKVGAGHVDWMPTVNGPVPIPKSTNFPTTEQGAMEKFHGHFVDFMRTDYASSFLWPHLSQRQRIDMVESILGGFDE